MYFLAANPLKPQTIDLCAELAKNLLRSGEHVVMADWLHRILQMGQVGHLDSLSKGFHAVIAVGGDGTLLRTAAHAAEMGVPMLGINMGRVGFLLEADPNSLSDTIERLRQGKYELDERMMLRAKVNDSDERLVLNDVVLCRGENPSSITVDVLADEELVYSTHGDGMIVSTPTGSTAYCLSAGGPVLHPNLSCTVVLPICTHKAQQLPVVLSQETVIRLHAMEVPGRAHQVIIDGQTDLSLRGTVDILIRKAEETAKFIRLDNQQFFTRLRLKQAEWSGK